MKEITKEDIDAIQTKWYSEERSPINIDNKWFMDMGEFAYDLLKERDRLKTLLHKAEERNRKIVKLILDYKREMENPVPDAIYRRNLREALFKEAPEGEVK